MKELKTYYLINDYNIKEFNTEEEVERYIKDYLESQNLSYELISNFTNNGLEVLIYQYYTLYFETFIITQNLDHFTEIRIQKQLKLQGE